MVDRLRLFQGLPLLVSVPSLFSPHAMESMDLPERYSSNILAAMGSSSGSAARAPSTMRYPNGGVKPMVLFPSVAESRDSAFSRIPM